MPKPTCMAPLVEYLQDHHPEMIENALREVRSQTGSAMHVATIVNTDAMQQLTGNQDLPPQAIGPREFKRQKSSSSSSSYCSSTRAVG